MAVLFQYPHFYKETGVLPTYLSIFPLNITIVNTLLSGVSALVEEVLYRGFLVSRLEETDSVFIRNNIFQGVVFTTLHLTYLSELTFLVPIETSRILLLVVQAFIVSLVFAWLRKKHNTLASPIIVHVFINLFGIILR